MPRTRSRSLPRSGRRAGALVALGLPAAALLGLIAVGTTNPPPSVGTEQQYAADTDSFADIEDLVAQSALAFIGVSDGQAGIRTILADGLMADFEQEIQVTNVIKGTAAEAVTVVRLGINPEAETLPRARDQHVEAAGAIPAGMYIFFLQPAGDDLVWSVVGHDQGAMRVDAAGKVTSPFPELSGLALDEAESVIRSLMRRQP